MISSYYLYLIRCFNVVNHFLYLRHRYGVLVTSAVQQFQFFCRNMLQHALHNHPCTQHYLHRLLLQKVGQVVGQLVSIDSDLAFAHRYSAQV